MCVCHLASSPRPSEGEGKEGLVHTACACAVILQILDNPITSGYCLYTFADAFTVKYMENAVHVRAVSTRPSFPFPLPLRKRGDKASMSSKVSEIQYFYMVYIHGW